MTFINTKGVTQVLLPQSPLPAAHSVNSAARAATTDGPTGTLLPSCSPDPAHLFVRPRPLPCRSTLTTVPRCLVMSCPPFGQIAFRQRPSRPGDPFLASLTPLPNPVCLGCCSPLVGCSERCHAEREHCKTCSFQPFHRTLKYQQPSVQHHSDSTGPNRVLSQPPLFVLHR
jgi:hypothetical protein